tara:strand:+ start:7904 stop:8605 length:702 start_codon:yes stop_codon:yes gene_type:complete
MDDINVILTVWKRNNLERQLACMQEQSANISDIYVYQNESHLDIEYLKEKYDFYHIHCKNKNFKFHGRFTLPLLFDSTYTAIFDDDTIPGSRWLEHCVNVSKKNNCIVGANCRNYRARGHDCGEGNAENVRCDIVGHCWFFKTSWAHYMWREKPPTYDNGEDIHFCAACKMHGNIDSYFPSQPQSRRDLWGDTHQQLGQDQHAQWRKANHTDSRWAIYEHWIQRGWKINDSNK